MENKTITIAGQEFSVPLPYLAGHTLTEAEAKALNQMRCENIRNNQAKAVKVAYESGDSEAIAKVNAAVAEYASAYEFTLAAVGERAAALDPVEKEARVIARGILSQLLKNAGKTKKDFEEDYLEAKIAEFASSEDVVKQAKANVKAKSKVVDSVLSMVSL